MPIYETFDQEALTEAVNLTFDITPTDEIPKDYYKTVGNLFDAIKSESKRKVGEGPGDAFFNAAFANKTREDFEKATNRNAFVFIIPSKLRPILFKTPKAYEEFAEKCIKKAGFKKGAADTVVKYTYYYYKYSPDKKHMYVVFFMSPHSIGIAYQTQLSIRCVKNNDHNKFVRESAMLESTNSSNVKVDTSVFELEQKNKLGFIFNPIDDSDLVADSIGEDLRKYVAYPQLERAFMESFDYRDNTTRKQLISMNEVEHNKVLTDLTSKLYDQIVAKTHNIDYGEIPKTKGDITKLSNYEELKDTLGIIKGIVKEYKQDSKPIDEISIAISNIESRKDLFERAFRYDCELPMLMYDNMVMAVVTGTTYMITSCIEFIKAPKDETFKIQLDKVAYNKSKDALIYNTISKFNKSCHSGDFDKAMNMIIDKKIKKFTGIEIAAGVVGGIIILVNIVPILRELTYLFFYNRVKLADFFAVQADLLTMNAYNLQHNDTMDVTEREEIAEKQLAIAEKFRAVSNKFNIEKKYTEVNATRDIEKTGKKYKLDDDANIVADDAHDASDSSVLF